MCPRSDTSSCQQAVLMIEKMFGAASLVAVGDSLIIRSFNFPNLTIACGTPHGVCKPQTFCGPVEDIDYVKCIHHQLRLFVPGKSIGDPISHGDTVLLRYESERSGHIGWIGCNLTNKRICKRRIGCPSSSFREAALPQSCPFETFQIFSL